MHFIGMHILWWLFWIIVISGFFALLTPVPRKKIRKTPLQILEHRYAAGEIGTQEYQERRTRLERDASSATR